MQNYETFTNFFGPLTELISSCLIAVVTIAVVSKTTKLNTKRNLLSDIYVPVFNLIEPYLYQKLSIQTASELINEFESIIQNASYVPPEIALPLNQLKENLSKNVFDQESYTQLCRHIDSKYDKLCKAVGFPIRSIVYRIQKKQFPSKLYFGYSLTKYIVAYLGLFILTLLFMLLLMYWLKIFIVNVQQL